MEKGGIRVGLIKGKSGRYGREGTLLERKHIKIIWEENAICFFVKIYQEVSLKKFTSDGRAHFLVSGHWFVSLRNRFFGCHSVTTTCRPFF
jgi:hypothetical protein